MMTTAVAESELVQRARAGDTRAFGALVLEHQTFAYNLALRALGDTQDAQDLTQEAFLRAWQGLASFRGASSFRTWLYRIVINLCYNHSPQVKRSLANLDIEEVQETWLPGQNPGPEQQVEASELRAFLHHQIENLPTTCRLLVMLRYQRDLSYEEIAEVMDMPLGTVKTGLFRAHTRLKAALNDSAFAREPGEQIKSGGLVIENEVAYG